MPQPLLGLQEVPLDALLVPTEAQNEDNSLLVSSDPHDGHST